MDFVSDQNPRPLYRIDALAGTPDWVTQAPIITTADTEKLASVAFADPVKREYPCFNKVATYLSYAYLRGTNQTRPDVEARVRKAGEAFGITAELDKIDQQLTQTKSATAAPVPLFALPAGSVKEANFNLYPINSREEIESSAHQLIHDRGRMPIGAYYKAAKAIVKAANQFPGTVLPAKVVEAGQDRYPNFEFAAKMAANRRFVVKDEQALVLYADLVKAAEATTDIDAEQFAELWSDLDRTYGVKYANGILDPYAALFSGPTKAEVEKMASTFAFVAETPVPMQVLQAIPETTLKQRFSTKTAEAFIGWRKLAAADLTTKLAQLDRAVQRELLRIAVAL